MRVALLGASSAIARRVARDLREQPEVTDVIELETGDTTIPPCELMAGFTAEAANDRRVAETAMDRGIPYLSSAADAETIDALLSLDDRARAADAPIVAGLGWTNGLSWAMVHAALDEESEPTGVRISSVVSAAGEYGAAAIDRLAGSIGGTAGVFESGGWKRVPSADTDERVYFPEPLGWREVWLSPSAEVELLPRSIPNLQKVVVLSGVSELAASRALLATRRLGARTASPLMRLANRAASRASSRAWSAIRVDVSGPDGTATSYAILDQLPNLLAAPLVAAVTLFARGQMGRSGALLPESAFAHSSFFTVLAERGVRVARLVR